MFGRLPTRSAFTLVEIMMTVALLGILAAVAITSFAPRVHEQLQSAAQIVANDLSYARSLAVANNSSYRLTFDLSQQRYVLEHTGANSSLNTLPNSTFWKALSSTQHAVLMDALPLGPPRVRLHAVCMNSASPTSVANVEFNGLGGTTRTPDTQVWLSCGTRGERRYLPVLVNPVTGLASVGEFTGTAPTLLGASSL